MSESSRLRTVITGNFDFVPAPPSSSSSSSASAASPRSLPSPPPAALSVSEQLQSLRATLRRDREASLTRRGILRRPNQNVSQAWDNSYSNAMSSPSTNPRRRVRHVTHRAGGEQPPSDALDDLDDSVSLPSLEARFAFMTPFSRTRAIRAMRFAALQNARRRGRQSNNIANDEMASLSELHQAMGRVPQLSDERHSRSHSRQLTPADTNETRRKRRRLDAEPPLANTPRIAYGYEGQVIAGRLNMQLVSTDCGVADTTQLGPNDAPTKYAAANVLRDDSSVYCTLSPRCNMILRHQGQTAFTLQKLVIRAPRHGFTDPVREGLVFVSMKNDDAFDRTAQYPIYHFPSSHFGQYYATTRRRRGSRNANDNRLPSFNSLTADDTWPTLQRSMDLDQADEDSDSDVDDDADEQSIDLAVSRGDNGNTMDETFERHWLFMRALNRNDEAMSTGETFRNAQAEYRDMLAQQDFDEVLRRGAAVTEDRRRRSQAMHRISRRNPTRSGLQVADSAALWSTNQLPPPSTTRTFPRDYSLDAEDFSEMDEDRSSSDEASGTDLGNANEFGLDTALMEPNARFSMISRSDLRKRGRRHVTRHLKRIEASFDEPQAGDSDAQPCHYTINRSSERVGLPRSIVGDVMQDTVDGRRVTLRHVRTTSTIQSDNKIAIKFDPPISARFILLKLWNPKSSDGRSDGTGNIDIEAVQAYGWAGPQFFPATEMR